MHAVSERTTVVYCADWPVAAVTAGRSVTASGGSDPAGVFHANRVIAANSHAKGQGVQPGMRRREAQRRAPDLVVYQRDHGAEARAFEVVLSSLDAITPRVEVEQPGWCSFATLGPSRYFGGDASMSARLVSTVIEALAHGAVSGTTVHVGTADTRFAAHLAAQRSTPGASVVVAPGASPEFLAPLPASTLGDSDLVDVLARLGLHTLGAFAQLPATDVLGRFGAAGLVAHQRAQGEERRLSDARDPAPDFVSSIALDPPIDRVDQAAFVAKTLADEFCRRLSAVGATCSRVAIVAETEHGEELVRLWRGDGAFSANAIADRMRWQLDGWLHGSSRSRPSGGLSRLELRPDEVIAAVGRQLGFWGEETQGAERAARAVARVQGIVGLGQVSVPERSGGRSLDQEVVRVPAEAVDLVERALGDSKPQQAPSAHEYPGRVPSPLPAVVLNLHRPVRILDQLHQPVVVEGRGLLSAPPVALIPIGANGKAKKGEPPLDVVGWAGPWLIDERWWDTQRHRRRARLQLVTADGRAQLVACERGEWFIEAVYD